jgi:hypothetical protein
MVHLALDLSKRSTGFAAWQPGWAAPRFGHWVLGSEFTTTGQTFVKLHRNLSELMALTGQFETVTYEEPLLLGPAAGNTSAETQLLLIGLMAHTESFCAAKRIRRCQYVNQASWRKHFIGSMKRGTKRTDLKALVMERCREHQWHPRKDDEADALGILDYALHIQNIEVPWRFNAMFGGALRNAP